MVGHVAPEAAAGGPIAIVEDGDVIVIDAQSKRLMIKISDEELNRRLRNWQPPPITYPHGALAKYAKLVS
jgi:dihydroxyacid dehydratase (EC 4.2.1.9)